MPLCQKECPQLKLAEFSTTSSLTEICHWHFITIISSATPGGVAIFFVDNIDERDALMNGNHLPGWNVEIHPLIFSHSPAAFDEQIAFTLKAYRNENWELLQKKDRPRYGNPRIEAETATEDS